MVAELYEFFVEYHRRTYEHEGAPIHDAVAVAQVLRPGIVETLNRHVDVDCESQLCRGRTVVDLWRRTENEPNVESASTSTRTGSSSSSASGSPPWTSRSGLAGRETGLSMAPKKRPSRVRPKSPARVRKKKRARRQRGSGNHDLLGLGLLAAGLFLAVVTWLEGNGGIVGTTIADWLDAVFGTAGSACRSSCSCSAP